MRIKKQGANFKWLYFADPNTDSSDGDSDSVIPTHRKSQLAARTFIQSQYLNAFAASWLLR